MAKFILFFSEVYLDVSKQFSMRKISGLFRYIPKGEKRKANLKLSFHLDKICPPNFQNVV